LTGRSSVEKNEGKKIKEKSEEEKRKVLSEILSEKYF
jgi:hypothetical protein